MIYDCKCLSFNLEECQNILYWFLILCVCVSSLCASVLINSFDKKQAHPEQCLTQTSLRKRHTAISQCKKNTTRFQMVFYFHHLLGEDSPCWLIFFKWVETSNHSVSWRIFLRYSTLTEDQLLLLRTGIYTTFFALPGCVYLGRGTHQG